MIRAEHREGAPTLYVIECHQCKTKIMAQEKANAIERAKLMRWRLTDAGNTCSICTQLLGPGR